MLVCSGFNGVSHGALLGSTLCVNYIHKLLTTADITNHPDTKRYSIHSKYNNARLLDRFRYTYIMLRLFSNVCCAFNSVINDIFIDFMIAEIFNLFKLFN